MSPRIMYMTSSLGSLWNSLRPTRPRATKAIESGACQSTFTGFTAFFRPSAIWSRLTPFICCTVVSLAVAGDAVDLDVHALAVRGAADARSGDLLAGHEFAECLVERGKIFGVAQAHAHV